jgi:lysophospholipase L1-like esterase
MMNLGLATIASRFRLRARARQGLLPFRKRMQRLDRIFRGLIVALTLFALGGAWVAWPSGRSRAIGIARQAKWGALRQLGLEPARSEVDAYWRNRRDRREVATRAKYEATFPELSPETQALFRAAGMGPDDAILRWGNYDMTLVLSGQVFDRVDSRRGYRLRPSTRSMWLKKINLLGMHVCVLQFPDTPEVRRLASLAGAEIIPGPVQTSNSWGCRGAEPNMNAPVRGLVLGDSFMQGYLVGDGETPPEQLRRCLQVELGTEVAVLNTGTLGYGPEHYYDALRAFVDRIRPQFVVVGLYSNDFGEDDEVIRGEGDWVEAKHWLCLIVQECHARGIVCLFAPVPCEGQLIGVRNMGNYPGQVSNITSVPGRWFCDPADAFINEDLKFRPPWHSQGITRTGRCHLYNGDLGDGHLSPAGASVWGELVAHRLRLIIGKDSERAQQTAGGAESMD